MKVTYRHFGGFGRLGNMCFQLAGTIGIADTLGATVELPRWEYQPCFALDETMFVDHIDPGAVEASPFAARLHPDERVYLQDYGLWAHIHDRVWQQLQPSEASRQELERTYPWFSELTDPIAVHVRRGDYLATPDYHPALPFSYYERALDSYDASDILVFSDDLEWCRAHFTEPNTYFVDGHVRPSLHGNVLPGEFRDHLDLFLQSACSKHVIGNSSYSWWGAMLSTDQSPRYPSVWYGPAATKSRPELMIPPGWTRIDAS